MMLPPGSVIGIVGGGQLGRMTVLAAARLGYRCHILTPEPDAPASQVTSLVTVAAYDDPVALERFAASVDVVTIEFENLPLAPLIWLAERGDVHPAPSVLGMCQDRLFEKDFLAGIDVPTTTYVAIDGPEQLAAELAARPRPAILKSRRMGYDGKGQVRLAHADEAGAAWRAMGAVDGLLEDVVDFAGEISVITARGIDGALQSYVPVTNRHRNHILDVTLAPADLPEDVAAEAVELAERIATRIGLIGLIAVEMFQGRTGRLLVNELAPRPHNSGHWTIDACAVSQFEQLVRAICGLPLGDPARMFDARMDNLIGGDVDRWPDLMAEPNVRLHLYGKSEARHGRKMGHVTRLNAPAGGRAQGPVDRE